MKTIITILTIIFLNIPNLLAASDQYDRSGKIYTVVACVSVILIGVALFLFFLERRISKMEREYDD